MMVKLWLGKKTNGYDWRGLESEKGRAQDKSMGADVLYENPLSTSNPITSESAYIKPRARPKTDGRQILSLNLFSFLFLELSYLTVTM